jgi:hypothetical protein
VNGNALAITYAKNNGLAQEPAGSRTSFQTINRIFLPNRRRKK